MTGRICLLGLGLALLGADGDGEASRGRLTVVVSGLESDEGRVVIALLDSADSYENEDRAYRDTRAQPSGGTASATFEGVEFGAYAVKVFHDENGNGKLDTNFIGIPKERFGFSNNVMGRFGPPDFEQARFVLDRPELTLEIDAVRPF